ncbi:hypothetical protein FDV58_37045 [Bradyrhizobium elkanii]|uniref:Uncharacterized protein n=2 Tax=Nitrobacteraceae TaxID=41294 RepID=A0A4U6RIU5_BRAEL|nr:hypothetical protein [Bradyrhizobium sp. BR2003]TKV73548.1 hypothetical protein FDV58_37045 [Bradyrhizobium elkanii]
MIGKSEQDLTMRDQKLADIKEKGVAEARRLFWIVLYLWVLLGLFAVHRSIVLNQQHVLYHQGFAFINALVLAKIMFIAEAFNVAEDMKHKPLIYPIVYKSAVYAVILMSFHVVEDALAGLWRGKTLSESIPSLGGGNPEEILVMALIMFVVLMPFFALREVGRDIGDDKLYEQFFVRRTKYIPVQS